MPSRGRPAHAELSPRAIRLERAVWIAAGNLHRLPVLRIEIVRVERRVDLDVRHAVADEPFDFVADDRREIRQQRFAILVDAIGDVELEAGRHEVRRRGHGDLEGHAERRGQLQHERQLRARSASGASAASRRRSSRTSARPARRGRATSSVTLSGMKPSTASAMPVSHESTPQFAVATMSRPMSRWFDRRPRESTRFHSRAGSRCEHQPLGIASSRDHQGLADAVDFRPVQLKAHRSDEG